MTTEEWPTEWLRAVLGLAVLGVLDDAPAHGYAVAQRLAERGLGDVRGGTLYPLLGRLQDAGWVEGEWEPGSAGPGRKVFRLTPAGRRHLAEQGERWAAFCRTTGVVLSPSTASERTPR